MVDLTVFGTEKDLLDLLDLLSPAEQKLVQNYLVEFQKVLHSALVQMQRVEKFEKAAGKAHQILAGMAVQKLKVERKAVE